MKTIFETDKLDVEFERLFLYVKCKRCSRIWGMKIESLDSLEEPSNLPLGWNICLDCARKEKHKLNSE
jgi:hypothetical protein